jgi:hypothetical protein
MSRKHRQQNEAKRAQLDHYHALDIEPHEAVGFGLSQEMADEIFKLGSTDLGAGGLELLHPLARKQLTLTGLPPIFNARYREAGAQGWHAEFTDMRVKNGQLSIWAPEGKCLEFEFRCAGYEWERVTIDARTTTHKIELKPHGITCAAAEIGRAMS